LQPIGLGELPVKLFRDATVELDSTGAPAVKSSEPISEITRAEASLLAELDVVFRDHLMMYHYFHFMELALGLSAVLAHLFPAARVRKIYFGKQVWNNPDQNRVQPKILRALFNPARVIESDLQDYPSNSSALLLVDRFAGGHREFNKFLEPLEAASRRNHDQVRSRVWQWAGTQDGPPKKRAIYISRQPPRTLLSDLEERLFAMFGAQGIDVEKIDFANSSWEGQVQIAREANLMIGVHGNGLTNLLWMPAGSTVIELFPDECHHYDYQFFAEIAGMQYYGVEGKETSGYVYTAGSRLGAASGNANRPVKALPERALSRILEVLQDSGSGSI
jgi:hypothetical protein